MRFIADAMLGRLARWLRFLGFDTLYLPHIGDRTLLRIALEQGRFILTRDTHFKKRGIDNCLIVGSDFVEEQLAQVLGDLGLRPPEKGRCVVCNSSLREVADKREVRDLVPEHVYINAEAFNRCSECGKVYWEGTHYRNFKAALRKIMDEDGEE